MNFKIENAKEYDFENHIVLENDKMKIVQGKDNNFNLAMQKSNGFTIKFGKTLEDDPDYCSYGPEIADIELTKICAGIRQPNGEHLPCPWCYKQNTAANKDYMGFDKFKHIFDKIVKN